MKSIAKLWLIIVLIAVPTAVAYSAEMTAAERQAMYDNYTAHQKYIASQDLHHPSGRFEIGPQVSYFNYEEPDFMEEKGMFYGLFANYTYKTQENGRLKSIQDFYSDNSTVNVFRIETSASFGMVDYESNGTGEMDNIDDFMLEGRFLAGYDFPILKATTITPLAGIGIRYLNDDSGGMQTTTGHFGYERESRYLYIPVGFETKTALNDVWSWGIKMEYDIFIDGEQKSHVEDVDPSFSTLENEQDDGYGVRAALRIEKETERLNYLVEPYYRMWKVDDSDIGIVTCGGTPCLAGYEPENEQWEAGVRLGVSF